MSEHNRPYSLTQELDETDCKVFTVLGPVSVDELGFVDAHAHVWIEAIPGISPGSPVLNDRTASLEELARFRKAGGGTIVDCQPYGCGRNGRVLADLALASGLQIVACTGFHLRKYYPKDSDTWRWTEQQAADFFVVKNLFEAMADGLQRGCQPGRLGPVMGDHLAG